MSGLLLSPVSAQEPAIALEINAIPGVAIDICVGGVEVHSRQPYTWRNIWGPIDPPTQSWAIRKASRGECTGPVLGKFHATFEPGKTYSVVYWRPRSKVRMRIFEGQPPVDDPERVRLEVHHVAKAGSARARIRQPILGQAATKIAGIAKGTVVDAVIPASLLSIRMAPESADPSWTSAQGHIDDVEAGTVYQAFFMGSGQDDMSIEVWPAASLADEPPSPARGARGSARR